MESRKWESLRRKHEREARAETERIERLTDEALEQTDQAATLKAYRLDAGWTQKQLGDALGKSDTFVSQIENLDRPMPEGMLEDAIELLEDPDGEPRPPPAAQRGPYRRGAK